MKTRIWKLVPLVLLAPVLTLVLGSLAEPASSPPSVATLRADYIGAQKCKNCHSSSDSGDAYGKWQEAMHSDAYERLSSAESKELAKQVGIEDPQKAEACVRCHVTGHGEPEDHFARGFDRELGVQCETCHGPGQDHMKARFKAAMGKKKGAGYEPLPEGEMIVSPGVETCVGCHNPESPSYKPFCYYEALPRIAHLDPRKERSEEERAKYGTCPHGSPCPHAEGCPDGTCNLRPEKLAELRK